ncbi:MAG TPA: hypothetical protein VI818_07375 [Candidatus Thermoplasmatota archaeon]|nr:hypothetical protein [Candidatus Thermoplasmatota archaeon]
MVTSNKMDLILGIVMLVLGILIITGNFSFGPIVMVVGIALIVLGVLMLIKRIPGGTLIGVVAIVLGALLVIPDQTFGDPLKPFVSVAHIVIGVLLIVFGVLKIMGK